MEEILKTQSHALETRLIQQASDLEIRLKRVRSPTIAIDATICEKFTEFGDCVIAPVMCNSHKLCESSESTKIELLPASVEMSQTKEELEEQ